MAMSFKEAALLAHQVFRELAVHQMNLAASLQSLVPSNKEQPSKSAQYLYENGLALKELSEQVKVIMLSSSASPLQ